MTALVLDIGHPVCWCDWSFIRLVARHTETSSCLHEEKYHLVYQTSVVILIVLA